MARDAPVSEEAVELGRKIREKRVRLGLTGQELAEQTGINPTSLSFMERGYQEPSPEQLRALATALGITFRFAPGRAA